MTRRRTGASPRNQAVDVIPEQVLQFVRQSIKSVWTLDLMILMRRHKDRAWTPDALAGELRANRALVQEALSSLVAAGILVAEPEGAFRYGPADAALEDAAAEVERHYIERPLALIRAIVSAPNEKIQSFADAFRFKKD
jgi:hypothetical protein